RVQVGSTAERKFTIENVSASQVQLSVVRTTCGCLGTSFGESTLPVGGTTTFVLKASVLGGLGEQQHVVEIECKAVPPDGSEAVQRAVLPIRFTPDRWLEWEPRAIVLTTVAGTRFQ